MNIKCNIKCNTTLPVFYINEFKNFKFSNDQYRILEIEYNRYFIYKNLIKQIEQILNIVDSNEYNKRKKYENKNIIERFVLECINHGISPHIDNIHIPVLKEIKELHVKELHKELQKDINKDIHYDNENTTDCKDVKDINYEQLSHYLFFNQNIKTCKQLQNTYFYKKMLSEYNEKKIKFTPDKLFRVENAFINSEKLFEDKYNELTKTTKFENIDCSITLKNNDFIIKYKNYVKTIDCNRYYKLIKNYDKPFPYDIIRMLLRYGLFDTSSQQWSIGINLYEDISEIFNISFEMFASPLNFNMNMFCSIFYDTDHIFGSMGSFYNLTIEKLLMQNIKGVFFNPPYLPILMKKCTLQCLDILDKMNNNNVDFTIFSFLPNWIDADYINLLINSKYNVSHKVVSKGNYILHEKDKGKLINGTFDLLVIVLNSSKLKWTSDKLEENIKGFNTVIKLMKNETKDASTKN